MEPFVPLYFRSSFFNSVTVEQQKCEVKRWLQTHFEERQFAGAGEIAQAVVDTYDPDILLPMLTSEDALMAVVNQIQSQ